MQICTNCSANLLIPTTCPYFEYLKPEPTAAERMFSALKRMFGDAQMTALADYIQAALMLCYNERPVG